MVRNSLFFYIVLLSSIGTASDWKLKLNFSKNKVFEGEQVIAQYFVETVSDSRAVEIEVMKFPEFRNFWSENTLLRQGPVQLFSFPQLPQISGVLMGSYVLYPMLNTSSRSINPLKLLVKSYPSDSVVLLSEGSELEVMPLPKTPAELQGFAFFGGVGSFVLSVDRTRLPYRPKQPFRLEVALEGDGNFSEINKLPLDPPASCTFISESSFIDFFRGRNKKIFQWNMTCEEDPGASFQPKDLLYFDPLKKQYQKLSFPRFSFELLPELKWENDAFLKDQIKFERPSGQDKDWPDLSKTFWFWTIQAILLLAIIIFSLRPLLSNRKIKFSSHADLPPEMKIKKITRAIKNKNVGEFTVWTARLAESELQKPHWPQIPPQDWKVFVKAYQEIQFSPEKQSKHSFAELKAQWLRCYHAIKH